MKPSIKTLRGCTAPPEQPLLFPPMTIKYEGERFKLDTCPINMFTTDIIEVFKRLNLSGGNISLTEQLEIPKPYLDALIEAKHQQSAASAARIESKRNG